MALCRGHRTQGERGKDSDPALDLNTHVRWIATQSNCHTGNFKDDRGRVDTICDDLHETDWTYSKKYIFPNAMRRFPNAKRRASSCVRVSPDTG